MPLNENEKDQQIHRLSELLLQIEKDLKPLESSAYLRAYRPIFNGILGSIGAALPEGKSNG